MGVNRGFTVSKWISLNMVFSKTKKLLLINQIMIVKIDGGKINGVKD